MLIGLSSFYVGSIASTNKTSSTTSSSGSTSTSGSSSCPTISPARSQQLTNVTFDAVTKFALPSPVRSPNSITVAPDGSVWFGEEAIPGVAHLFANGTLTEYTWPFAYNPATSACGTVTNIWGVALWDGRVWATDSFGNRLVGVDPSSGAVQSINLTANSFPYTLAVGPNNSLWFTQLFGGPKIGKVSPSTHAIQYYTLPTGNASESTYLFFANSTLGYVLGINAGTGAAKLLSFNPQSQSPVFQPVGGNQTLYDPTSIAVGEGGIWLTEHSATSMAFFNATSAQWTIYPLSTVPFVNIDVTHFDASNGTSVWFNEHYANRMGVISDDATQLTEYSVSDPPVDNLSSIGNAVTTALGDGRFWFTEWTANYVGFVNTSYVLPFSISNSGNATVQITAGGSAQAQVRLSGKASNLSLQFADNEVYNSTPIAMTFTPSVRTLSLDGSQTVTVSISVASSIKPGDYVATVTVTDGLILRSVFIHIVVTG